MCASAKQVLPLKDCTQRREAKGQEGEEGHANGGRRLSR